MQVHQVTQGSQAWHALRAQHFCGSDAAAAMGVSKYKQRGELLREKATGYTPEVDAAKQRLFDGGHAAEAAARPLVEADLGEELFPCVGTLEVDGLPLLASFDGQTMMGDIIWESKQYNAALASAVADGNLEPHYWAQLEHALLVSGAEKAYFTTTDGTPERMVGMWYVSVPERRAQVIAAWQQFAADMAAYQPTAAAPVVVAAAQPSLPAPVVRMDGALTVASNLPDFAVALRAYIDNIPKTPSSDQEFADCEAACKSLKKAEDALQQAEDGALAQMTDVEQMRRVVGDLRTLARTTRLASEKMVAARKEQIRTEIYESGCKAYRDHIAGLNARLGKTYMPTLPADFAGAIKNKRTVDSLRDAVATHLATVKIAANEVADRIQINLDYLREHAKDHAFLFADTAAIVLKAPDDLAALAQSRIMAHQKAEADRLERERAAIAEQERVKAEAKVRAEQEAAAKAELDRRNAEAKALEAVAPPARAQPVAEEPAPLPAQTFTPPAPYSVERPAVERVTAKLSDTNEPPSLNLGRLNSILADRAGNGITVTAAFLLHIGCPPAATERGASLYYESDVLKILQQLGAHLNGVYEARKTKQRRLAAVA